MPQHPGDPTPQSPDDVLANRAYHCVHTVKHSVSGSTIPLVDTVVLHRGTETYWHANYYWNRSADTMCWEQVEPVLETRTIYKRK